MFNKTTPFLFFIIHSDNETSTSLQDSTGAVSCFLAAIVKKPGSLVTNF